MPITQVTGAEIENGSIKREDLYTGAVPGEGVVTNLVGGTNINLVSTGGQPGTGQVTISVDGLLYEEPVGSDYATLRRNSAHYIGPGSHYSALLAGVNNYIDNDTKWSVIVAGRHNFISAGTAVIGGGSYNRIETSPYFTTSHHTFIGGGRQNTITSTGTYSSVVGGQLNDVYNGAWDFIGGGRSNQVGEWFSSVINGQFNDVFGRYSTIVSGYSCYASNAYFCFIGSGWDSHISPYGLATEVNRAFIGTGVGCEVKSDYSSILVGKYCAIRGASNCAILNAQFSTIHDGSTNSAIVSGQSHEISGRYDSIVSGHGSSILGGTIRSSVVSGDGNDILSASDRCAILSGSGNSISGSYYSAIVAGNGNEINDSSHITIINGVDNVVESNFVTILGGYGNNIERGTDHSVIFGRNNFLKADSERSFLHGENVWAYDYGHKAWSPNKYSTDLTSQVSEYVLKRVSGTIEGDYLPMYLDWNGDRKITEGGSGSKEITIPAEYGIWRVYVEVTAFFTYTGVPGGPIPQNRYKVFSGSYTLTYNGSNHLIDGSLIGGTGVSMFSPFEYGPNSDKITCKFHTLGNKIRVNVNDDQKQGSVFWQAYVRVNHTSIRA